MNLIGVCVVSGNVRRSAQIMFGEATSEEYLDLKNYKKNPQRANYGWTSESLPTTYSLGIALSYEQWGLKLATDYLGQASVALDAPGAAGNLKKIATQRYIAHYPDGMQAWNIWRKTGFPVLTPAPDATNSSKQIPRRYTYGSTEFTSNKANAEAAVAALTGGDTQDAKVWWNN